MNIRMVAAESGDTGLSEMVLPYVEGGFGKVQQQRAGQEHHKAQAVVGGVPVGG